MLHARPYSRELAGVVGTMVVIALLALIPPFLMRELIDTAIPTRDTGLVAWLAIGLFVAPLLRAATEALQGWLAARAGQGMVYDLRRMTFRHVQRMSLRFFTHTRLGTLVTRLHSDVVGAQYVITSTFVMAGTNLVTVIAIGTVLFVAEWRLTLLALIVLPFFVWAARRVARLLRRASQDQMEHQARLTGQTAETLSVGGSLMVRLFNRYGAEEERFIREASRVRDLGIRRELIGGWFFAALGAISGLGTAAVFTLGSLLAIQGTFTIGTVVMFAALLYQLYSPISNLTNARVEFATSMVSFERVFEVLDMAPEIEDACCALDLPTVSGAVAFEDVSFRYPTGPIVEEKSEVRASHWRPGIAAGKSETPVGANRWALRNLSFRATPGQVVALVGPSGAGKTTIGYLIPRLYEVTEGRITIDGHDIRDLSLATLQDAISVVTQEPYLFHDTIGSNLRYARPDAGYNDVSAACRNANIHDFITGLPQGYDTVVGQQGQRLSGGEKQRVGIARALLKDAPILILDEATSHLDSASEQLVQEALERVMKNRTTFVIAHRLATVLSADLILVLQDGKLVESGTHNHLLALDGLYASLYHMQFSAGSKDADD